MSASVLLQTVIIMLFSFSLTGCGNNNSIDNQEQNNNYTTSRTIATENNINNSETNIDSNISIDNINTEIELSSFSTKIYTPNDEVRQNNIRITCCPFQIILVRASYTITC